MKHHLRLQQPLNARLRRWLARLAGATLLSAAVALPVSAALDVQVQANPRPAQPGESVLVSITVSNSDGFDRSGVVLRMPYPAGLANLAHAATEGGSCDNSVGFNSVCEATELLTWNLGTVAAGKSITVTLPPVVAANTLPGTNIGLAIDVRDSFAGAASTTESLEIVNARVLQLSHVEVNQEPLQPGNAVVYQLSFGHSASSSVATNAVLELPVPTGFSFTSASDGGSFAGDRVVWNLGTLIPGQTGERRVTLAVSGTQASGSILKSEAVLRADGGKIAVSNKLTRIEAAPGLAVALDVETSPSAPGEVLSHTLTVSNPGFFDRSGVVAKMRFPVGLANLSEGLTQGGACDNSVGFNSTCESRELLSWDLGTIKAGKSISIQMPPVIGGAVLPGTVLPGTVLPFSIAVRDSSGGVTVAHESVQVTNARVLQLQLTEVTPAPVAPGQTLTYQLSFGHTASSAVSTNAAIELAVPPGLAFVSASDGGTLSAGKVRWALGALLPGQTGERSVRFSVSGALAEGSLLKPEALLSADGGKIARADALTRVEAASGLALALDVDAGPATPGERLSAKLTVSNTSFFDRAQVVVRLRFPTGFASLSDALIESGACDNSIGFNSVCEAREMLTWNLGTLRAGKSITVSLPPAINASVLPGSVIELNANATDSAGASASASEVLEIVNSRALQLGLSEQSQEPLLTGSQQNYRVSFGHTATSAVATNAVLELPVPAGLTFVSATGAGALVGGVVRWNLGNLNPAQVGSRDVLLQVNPLGAITTGMVEKLQATLSANGGSLVRSADTSRIETESPLAISLNLTPGARLPGEAVGVTLTVTNTSAFTRNGVDLRMVYPLGLASLSESFIPNGVCNNAVGFNSTCEPLETITWSLGSLPPGATVTRSFTPTVAATSVQGSLIEFQSWVQDSTARSRNTQVLLVGAGGACDAFGGDSDGDGICNSGPNPDNCTFIANPDQRDTDGDGFGNRCDADLDNNGIVNATDLVLFKAAFGTTGASLNADFDGNGVVNTTDLTIFKSLFGRPPGPAGLRQPAALARGR